MSYRFLKTLIFFLLLSLPAYTAEIPKAIKVLGFTEETLITYYREANEEIFIFSDKDNKEHLGIVTFVFKDGKIKEWYKSDVRRKKDKKMK